MSVPTAVRRTFLATSACVALLLAAPLAAPASGATATPGQGSAASLCVPITFDTAALVVTTAPDGTKVRTLTVTGTSPGDASGVSLVPVTYIMQPDYWGIEVVDCVSGIGLGNVPYTVTLDVSQTLGKLGIEVIGAIQTQQFTSDGVPVVPPAV